MVEEKIAELYPEQEMRCPVHLCVGQEAVAVGVCAALQNNDRVLSGHRSHGPYLARGGNLDAMMAELYGRATGCSLGMGGSMHLVDLAVGFMGSAPIVGSTIAIAVGTAFGAQMRAEPRVTVVFFGDGAVEEGVFHESLNFAALRNLPVVFVCENNLYSVYSPLSVRQPRGRPIVDLARGLGVESHRGDGNDVIEVYALAAGAIGRARKGLGPTFLELETYRWREHCGPNYDNDLGYRTPAEFEEWKGRCPVQCFKSRLLDDGLMTERLSGELIAELESEIRRAVAFAKASPYPSQQLLHEHVYAPPSARIVRE